MLCNSDHVYSDNIAYCEDVLGEFPETDADAANIISGRTAPRAPRRLAGDTGWQEIGYKRAISRWKNAAADMKRTGEFDDIDIMRAESALAAYRASGKTIPADLAQFLEIGETNNVCANEFEDDDYATLTENPDLMATDC